jgi:HD superfamily phosphohydrolase
LTEFLYPAANHTRFEHSLGVMEIATQAFDRLCIKHGSLMEDSFKSFAGFPDRPLERARQVLRLAALLHDIGHTAFSHAAESVVHARFNGKHDEFTSHLLETHDFGSHVDAVYWAGCAALVSAVVKGHPHVPPQLTVLHNIVSGEMDADRTDYLRRDAYHCGVDYGVFDYRRLLESLELEEDDKGGLAIALHRDGLHSFEALIVARYQMSTQVYYHRLRRIYDHYLERYFQTFSSDDFTDDQRVLGMTDISMLAQIQRDATQADGERKVFASRIFARKHHRWVHATGANANRRDAEMSQKLYESLRTTFEDVEFVLDRPRKALTIYKLWTPDDTDEEGRLPMLYLIRSNRSRVVITEESQILGKIPKTFQVIRIFAALERGERLDEIRQFAREQWHMLGGR